MLFSHTHDERTFDVPVHTLLEPELNTSGDTSFFKTDECCLCLLRFDFIILFTFDAVNRNR